jgi:hypothetical protein
MKGVYYDKRFNLWSSKIGNNNKLINLGSYKKKEDALKARLKGVLRFQGEYANQVEKDLIITLNIKTSSTKKNIVVNLNVDDLFNYTPQVNEIPLASKGPYEYILLTHQDGSVDGNPFWKDDGTTDLTSTNDLFLIIQYPLKMLQKN